MVAKVIPFRRVERLKSWRRADGSAVQATFIRPDILGQAFAAVEACEAKASFRERVSAFRRVLAKNFAPLRPFLRRQG